MKKFGLHLFILFSVLILQLFLLDNVYSSIYNNANPRLKFQYLNSFKNKKIDYIFLGSSRVENSIIPEIIEKRTNKKAINLGYQAAKLKDIELLIEYIYSKNITAKTIFIQVDYIYNYEDSYSNILKYEIAPFQSENLILKNYIEESSFKNKFISLYVPFFRFMENAQKIGAREIISQILNKKTNTVENKGYAKLEGTNVNNKYSLPKSIIKENLTFKRINKFIKKKNLNVVFFTSPFYIKSKNLNYIKKLKSKISNLNDFSRQINDSRYFHDNSHLNHEGAIIFTNHLIDYFKL